MKNTLLICCLLISSFLAAITNEDIKFLLDKEQFPLLLQYRVDIENLLNGTANDLKLALEYAQRTNHLELALRCHYQLALQHHSLDDAMQWYRLAESTDMDSLKLQSMMEGITDEFSAAEDKIILDYFLYGTPAEEYLQQIRSLRGYNPFIEELAKSWIDEISVQTSDSLATNMIEEFEQSFPISKWSQVAYYYHLYHLSKAGDFASMDALITSDGNKTPVHQYLSALYLMSPSYRKSQTESDNTKILRKALSLLESADTDIQQQAEIQVLYDIYTPEQWQNRIKLTRIKIEYFLLLADLNILGDEDNLIAALQKPTKKFNQLLKAIDEVQFSENDRGDLAELHFWKGKILAVYDNQVFMRRAAKSFTTSLVYGAPRKKYDDSNLKSLEQIHSKLNIKTDLHSWLRKLMQYQGIVFSEYPFPDKRYTRVAVGDYNNDGYNDLLFNGNALYRNRDGKSFEAVSDSTNLANLNSNGALWADFNMDGLLDFASISHDSEGMGESLMKNQNGSRFVKVNERAGDIDDKFPTEGAAWVDIDGAGYPSFYSANYEKWQERSGYPDFFWHNDKGYFSDTSISRGLRIPSYTDNPGQAGRGVAPADFDNDGKQEILVTNYRLNRNFCWKQADSLFVDVAALYGLSGKYKDGYYGHSIGADWGDYDNDGDLDLFIANLAHPRYIDISDVSQLLRNDGLGYRVIEADTLYFWQFTDVTKQSGITYDELHSDPLWLDADNDGDLDLFITSVYENDRSYLYQNNGNGTFTDITFLANARVYNGWGNATADLDRDGLADLVVGSGNGCKILLNRTPTRNRSLYIKPIWDKGKVSLLMDWRKFSQFPNSPAFGTRVKVTIQGPAKKTYSLIRELSSAKGTTSQSSQELHFGLSRGKVISIERITYESN